MNTCFGHSTTRADFCKCISNHFLLTMKDNMDARKRECSRHIAWAMMQMIKKKTDANLSEEESTEVKLNTTSSNQGDMLVLCYHLGSRSEVSYKQNRCGSGWICEHHDRFPTNNTWTTSYSWNQTHNSQNQEHIFNWTQQFIRDKKQRKTRFLKKLNLFGKTFYHNIYTRLFEFIFWNWNADIG